MTEISGRPGSSDHTGPEAVIRPMTSADLPGVMEIAASLSHAPHWTLEAYRAAIHPDAPVRRISLVAAENSAGAGAPHAGEASGPIHGFAIASLAGAVAELETIGVTPASQRRGVARRLLERLAEELRLAGTSEVWIEVRASNRAAAELYRGAGFSETSRRRAYYSDPVEDAVLMRRLLG